MDVSPYSKAIHDLQAGDPLSARALLLALPPGEARRDFLLGACAHAINDIPQAIRYFSDALKLDSCHAQAACALGSLFAGLGRQSDAEALFRQTLQRVEDLQLRFNLAVVLADQGQLTEALSEYSRILQSHPQHYAARYNRAGLYAREHRMMEAVADYRLLVRDYAAETMPWHNLAELELALGHYEEAIRLLLEVTQREKNNSKAALSLAVAYAAHGDMVESQAVLRQLKTMDPARWQSAGERINGPHSSDEPDPRIIFLVRAYEHLAVAHWRYWDQHLAIFKDLIAKPGDANYLALAYSALMFPLTAEAQLAFMRKISTYFCQSTKAVPRQVNQTDHNKISVAYVAPNWGNHVTAHLFRQLITQHSADFDVYVVSLRQPDNSNYINFFRQHERVKFLDLSALSDGEATETLAKLGLDIAVDLAVFNDDNRPAVLAARPAAIQLSWQAAPYSSGAPWIDYVISDEVVRPKDGWCSEAEVIMPSCYFTLSDGTEPPAVPTRDSVGLPNTKFVFSALNHLVKINPIVFRAWMQILTATSDSVLWLLASDTAAVLNLKREAEWQGVDPARLLFAPRINPKEHVARLGAADLFLDTWPCNGHTTMAESLWAGTPALSLKGDAFAGRVGASLLHSVGLPELVVDSVEAYIERAVHLQQNREALAALRERLASNRLAAACFNGQQQRADVEKAFREMVRRHRQGLQPAGFKISDL